MDSGWGGSARSLRDVMGWVGFGGAFVERSWNITVLHECLLLCMDGLLSNI